MFRDDVTRTIDQLVTRFSLSLPPTLLEGPGFQRMRLHPLERQGGGERLARSVESTTGVEGREFTTRIPSHFLTGSPVRANGSMTIVSRGLGTGSAGWRDRQFGKGRPERRKEAE